MHTSIPATKLVGQDFLGNHIGELLFRQPVKRVTPPVQKNNTSSNGSTVGPSETRTRRSSCATDRSELALSAASTAKPPTTALELLNSVGTIPSPLAPITDGSASLENSSEGSASEPGSVDSRSGSADADVLLHLDQLSVLRKRHPSEGSAKLPRVSFVTSFGAKARKSSSSRAPSEAGSSYFGMSSNMSSHMSSVSTSPTEQPAGAINWNMPFREQHQSFANALEYSVSLDRNLSQQSQSSVGASSQASAARYASVQAEVMTPTSSNGGGIKNPRVNLSLAQVQPSRCDSVSTGLLPSPLSLPSHRHKRRLSSHSHHLPSGRQAPLPH